MRMVAKWKLTRGFSLLEMLIAVAVLALVTAMAAPTFSASRQIAAVENKAMRLLSLLELAQSEAKKRHRAIYVHHIPVTSHAIGCIGLSLDSDVDAFHCDSDDLLGRLVFDSESKINLIAQEKNAPSKLFYFSPRFGSPSVDDTLLLAFASDRDNASGILVRRYVGVRGCSNTAITGWEACP